MLDLTLEWRRRRLTVDRLSQDVTLSQPPRMLSLSGHKLLTALINSLTHPHPVPSSSLIWLWPYYCAYLETRDREMTKELANFLSTVWTSTPVQLNPSNSWMPRVNTDIFTSLCTYANRRILCNTDVKLTLWRRRKHIDLGFNRMECNDK